MSRLRVFLHTMLCLFCMGICASTFASNSVPIPIRTLPDDSERGSVISGSYAGTTQSGEQKHCIGCHEDSYRRALANPHQHTIIGNRCETCHIIGANKADLTRDIDVSVPGGTSLLSLGRFEEEREYRLTLVASDRLGRKSTAVVISRKGTDVPVLPFPGLQKLDKVVVAEVKKEAFVRASFCWETDTYASSEVQYAADGAYPDRIVREGVLRKNHCLTAANLGHNKTYRFRVISTDLMNRSINSAEFTFHTSEEISNDGSENIVTDYPVISDHALYTDRSGSDLYLHLTVNGPSTLTASIEKSRVKIDDKHGAGLVEERYLAIDSCYECHPSNSSHPVDVTIRGGKMDIPTDLPTIESGVITCLTCHFAHGGSRPFYTRFDSGKEICLKCHDEYYDR